MSANNPPYVCQGRTDHSAQLFRMAAAILGNVYVGSVGATTVFSGGVHPAYGGTLAVTGQSSMNVQVATGACAVPSSTAWEGIYAAFASSTTTVGVPAASSTQYRADYIAAVVTDPGDATANIAFIDVEGTFSSTAPGSLPALPNNAIPLAIVYVVPNMTVTNGSGTVVDARPFIATPGTQVRTSATRPGTNGPNGQFWYETDTELLGVQINGVHNWIPTSSQNPADAWNSFNPSSNGWSTPSGTRAQYRYSDDGRSVILSAYHIQTGVTTDGTVIGNISNAAYRPISTHEFAVATDVIGDQSPHFVIEPNGNILCQGIGSTATFVSFEASYPLDL